jgi:hypothetical protein
VALLTAPQPVRTPPAKRGAGRLQARARSTPGRLVVLMTVVLALALAAGVAWVIGASHRSSLAGGVRSGSGQLAVQSQELYRALSDADATAASAFLSSGAEPADLRNRYQSDIAAATAALAAVSAGNKANEVSVQQISAQLPIYTGLVETARTYNRQGLPVGAAYLREASGLMRGQLLPAAQKLYQQESADLDDERGGAGALPWLALLLGIALVVLLVWAQARLSRQTHRTLNVGLLAATVLALVLVLWNGIAWVAVAAHLSAADRQGSGQVELLSKARIAALQARADEALTLVARGSGAAFETDFKKQFGDLINPDGRSGLLNKARDAATDDDVRAKLDAAITDVKTWSTIHGQLRKVDDSGDFPAAVKLTIGTDKGSAASIFKRVDDSLGSAIRVTSSTFDRQASAADDALTGQTAGGIVVTILLLAGVAVGYQQRIAEYR